MRKNILKNNLIKDRSISNRASVVCLANNPIPEDLPSEPTHISGGLVLGRISILD
jgi:hypothetical protein